MVSADAVVVKKSKSSSKSSSRRSKSRDSVRKEDKNRSRSSSSKKQKKSSDKEKESPKKSKRSWHNPDEQHASKPVSPRRSLSALEPQLLTSSRSLTSTYEERPSKSKKKDKKEKSRERPAKSPRARPVRQASMPILQQTDYTYEAPASFRRRVSDLQAVLEHQPLAPFVTPQPKKTKKKVLGEESSLPSAAGILASPTATKRKKKAKAPSDGSVSSKKSKSKAPPDANGASKKNKGKTSSDASVTSKTKKSKKSSDASVGSKKRDKAVPRKSTTSEKTKKSNEGKKKSSPSDFLTPQTHKKAVDLETGRQTMPAKLRTGKTQKRRKSKSFQATSLPNLMASMDSSRSTDSMQNLGREQDDDAEPTDWSFIEELQRSSTDLVSEMIKPNLQTPQPKSPTSLKQDLSALVHTPTLDNDVVGEDESVDSAGSIVLPANAKDNIPAPRRASTHTTKLKEAINKSMEEDRFDQPTSREEQELLDVALIKKGVPLHVPCLTVADHENDNCSNMSDGEASYIFDLEHQKFTREQERKMVIFEKAYEILLLTTGGKDIDTKDPASEKLFLGILKTLEKGESQVASEMNSRLDELLAEAKEREKKRLEMKMKLWEENKALLTPQPKSRKTVDITAPATTSGGRKETDVDIEALQVFSLPFETNGDDDAIASETEQPSIPKQKIRKKKGKPKKKRSKASEAPASPEALLQTDNKEEKKLSSSRERSEKSIDSPQAPGQAKKGRIGKLLSGLANAMKSPKATRQTDDITRAGKKESNMNGTSQISIKTTSTDTNEVLQVSKKKKKKMAAKEPTEQ